MPDEVIEQQQNLEPTSDAVIKEQMEIALGGFKSQQQVIAPAATVTEINNDADEVHDADEYLQQKLGFSTWDEAKAAFDDYKQLKEKPPTAAEIKFANEQSKKIHEALRAGKTEEVKNYIRSQELLSGIETKTDADKIKLHIQLTNPMFDDELVEDEFNERYGLDEEEFADNALKLKKEKIKIAQKMANDVKAANDFFSTYKEQIELPDISAPVDEEYVSYKKQKENIPNLAKEATEAYAKMTPSQIEQVFEFNDEANKLKIPFQYVPDANSFKDSVDLASDEQKFYDQFFKDGSPDRSKFLQFVHFGMNAPKIIAEAMKKASNATRLQMINSATEGGGAKREMVVTGDGELNEFDKQMEIALGRYMPKNALNGAVSRR